MSKTIAIDFDGVIHKYSKGWNDGTCYDEPVEGVLDFIQDLIDKQISVFILSTRNPKDIKEWLSKYWIHYTHIIEEDCMFWNGKAVIGITNRKLPAHVYIDDRGMKFDGSFDNTFNNILSFKTWQEEKEEKKLLRKLLE